MWGMLMKWFNLMVVFLSFGFECWCSYYFFCEG